MATREHLGGPWIDEISVQVERIYDRAKNEVLALIHSRPAEPTAVSQPEWMSANQLAEYWQRCNHKNEPTTAGILKWAKRRPDQFPLPHAYMGDLLRFNRDEVDLWAKQEAQRRREQSERRRLKIA